jgi:magnesium transporter
MKGNTPPNNENEISIVNQELVSLVRNAIEGNPSADFADQIKSLEYADLALLIENLSAPNREAFINIIRNYFNYDALLELSDHVQHEVVELLGVAEVAKNLSEMDSDDAFRLIDELPQESQEEILGKISASQRSSYEKLSSYPEDSAARMMQQEFVAVPSFWKVKDVWKYIQKSHDVPEQFYEIYVVDPKHTVVGVVFNSTILKNPAESKISDIMKEEFRSIPAHMDQEEVAQIFQHYDLISAPVVDESGRVIGMITGDDVVDVIEEEAERDILQMAGVSETDYNAPFYITSSRRVGWLIVTMVNALLGAIVIDHYQATIEHKGSLAALMTVVAAMGGANGMQVVAVSVRALASKILGGATPWRPIMKESLVGLVNALVFSMILVLIVVFWFNEPSIAIIIPISLVFNMCWASLAGVMIPYLIEKLGFDPAVSSGPLLTATTDVIGFASFLGLATLLI